MYSGIVERSIGYRVDTIVLDKGTLLKQVGDF